MTVEEFRLNSCGTRSGAGLDVDSAGAVSPTGRTSRERSDASRPRTRAGRLPRRVRAAAARVRGRRFMPKDGIASADGIDPDRATYSSGGGSRRELPEPAASTRTARGGASGGIVHRGRETLCPSAATRAQTVPDAPAQSPGGYGLTPAQGLRERGGSGRSAPRTSRGDPGFPGASRREERLEEDLRGVMAGREGGDFRGGRPPFDPPDELLEVLDAAPYDGSTHGQPGSSPPGASRAVGPPGIASSWRTSPNRWPGNSRSGSARMPAVVSRGGASSRLHRAGESFSRVTSSAASSAAPRRPSRAAGRGRWARGRGRCRPRGRGRGARSR